MRNRLAVLLELASKGDIYMYKTSILFRVSLVQRKSSTPLSVRKQLISGKHANRRTDMHFTEKRFLSTDVHTLNYLCTFENEKDVHVADVSVKVITTSITASEFPPPSSCPTYRHVMRVAKALK